MSAGTETAEQTTIPETDENASDLAAEFGLDEQQQAEETSTTVAEDEESTEKETEVTAGDDQQAAGEGEVASGEGPVFPDHLLRRAGLTAEQAVDYGFDTSESLQRAMMFAGDAIQASRQQAPEQRDQGDATADRAGESKPADGEFVPLKLEVSDDDVDATRELASKWESAINERLKADHDRIQTLNGEQESTRQANAESHAAEQVRRFDDACESIDSTLYGKGDYGALDAATKAARDATEEPLNVMVAGYRALGKAAPTMEELAAMAHRVAHGGEIAKEATRKIAQQLRDNRGQFTSRPTQRKGKALTRDQQAEINLGERLAKMGLPSDDDLDDDMIGEFGDG
jgi:hypothetical protein